MKWFIQIDLFPTCFLMSFPKFVSQWCALPTWISWNFNWWQHNFNFEVVTTESSAQLRLVQAQLCCIKLPFQAKPQWELLWLNLNDINTIEQLFYHGQKFSFDIKTTNMKFDQIKSFIWIKSPRELNCWKQFFQCFQVLIFLKMVA